MRIAYCPLHYGSDYLGWAIKSVYDYVDRIYILYSPTPSQGFNTQFKNPDSREKLKESAFLFGDPGNKIKWTEGSWRNEGEHRDAIKGLTSDLDVDMILALDADEIWPEEGITSLIEEAEKSGVNINRIRMETLWRSFSWHCSDNMWPIRLICPNRPEGKADLGLDPEIRIYHFGYARKLEDIEYKLQVQGHRGEWRSDWWGRYRTWPESGNNDFHPVCHNVWNISPFDRNKLPSYMSEHPYFNLEII
jgi:hypothetical protein